MYSVAFCKERGGLPLHPTPQRVLHPARCLLRWSFPRWSMLQFLTMHNGGVVMVFYTPLQTANRCSRFISLSASKITLSHSRQSIVAKRKQSSSSVRLVKPFACCRSRQKNGSQQRKWLNNATLTLEQISLKNRLCYYLIILTAQMIYAIMRLQ